MPETPQHRSFTSVRAVANRSEVVEWIDRLRKSSAWHFARRTRRMIDGDRCTFVDPRSGERCTQAGGSRRNPLDVHHVDRLTALYDLARGDYLAFRHLACDVDRLRSICRSHHPAAELEAIEREKGEQHGP